MGDGLLADFESHFSSILFCSLNQLDVPVFFASVCFVLFNSLELVVARDTIVLI